MSTFITSQRKGERDEEKEEEVLLLESYVFIIAGDSSPLEAVSMEQLHNIPTSLLLEGRPTRIIYNIIYV